VENDLMQTQKEKLSSSRILDVASKLFAEGGYSNVSIRDVCREAGTTAPMIYYYFGSKRGLFNAAVSRKISMKEFIARLRDRTAPGSPRQGIANFIETYLKSFPVSAFDPGLYMRETAQLDRDSAERINRDLDEIQRIATALVERGIKSGNFTTADASKAADCLVGMLNHIVFQKIHFSRSWDQEATQSFIMDFFFKALK
jgi:AcrR family transcriptional regulator